MSVDRRRTLVASALNISQFEAKHFTAIMKDSWPGHKVAILTAGDDTQGMNSTIRAVVRTGVYVGCQMCYIKHGFKGMVDGGDANYEDATWMSTSDIHGRGGTILKSYKCPEFVERWGRLKAAKNLVTWGIHNLVILGGDGTLKGVSSLYNDWNSLLQELEEKAMVEKSLIHKCRELKIICIPASILNDVALSEHSIGANSALHRIMEAVDAISTTASSSQLAFIVQVMGEVSGYLALVTALIYDASMVFLPEYPPVGNWRDEMCDKVKDDIHIGSEGILVVTCEGAIDSHGKSITPEEIKETLSTKLGLNAKITVLGHVQRGGNASAFDRMIACKMGMEAVACLKDIPVEAGPSVICFNGGSVHCLPLTDILDNAKTMEDLLRAKKYTEAVYLRGKNFQQLLNTYNLMHGLRSSVMPCVDVPGAVKIGIVRIGSSTISQCMVVRAVGGFCHTKNIIPFAFKNGFTGLINRQFNLLCWNSVKMWTHRENVCTDTSIIPASAVGLDKIAEAIQDLELSGLIIVGNFTAFLSLVEINQAMTKHSGLRIPMCMVPVTLANNVPGSDYSIGADSALNEIILYCEKMKRVARGQTKRVFVIETMGKDCGYLTSMCGLCVGADAAYIKQERFNLDTLLADAEHLKRKIQNTGAKIGLIICGEKANENYNTDFIYRVFAEEGKGVYTCRVGAIGHVSVGGLPSVQDRIMATTGGVKAGEWLARKMEQCIADTGQIYTTQANAKCVLCFNRQGTTFTPAGQLEYETDFLQQMPTFMHWMKLRPMMRILAKHDAYFELDFVTEFEDIPESRAGSYKPPVDS